MLDSLTLALCAGVPTAVIAATLAWAGYFRPKREGQRWAAAAQAIGFELEPGIVRSGFYTGTPSIAQHMFGERAGTPVRVGIRSVVTRSGGERSVTHYTYVVVKLPRSLELGLRVSPVYGSLLGKTLAEGEFQLGHPVLDRRYHVRSTVGDQARALLLTPYVAEALAALSTARFRPHLTDSAVALETSPKVFDPSSLSLAADQAVDLARRVISAHGSLGPSFIERVMTEAWRPVAEARGFVLDTESHTMSGRTQGVHVEVRATQKGDAFTTSFVARFDRPLGLGLSLERQQGAQKRVAAFFGQDIQIGDPEFDARFIVKGDPPEAVRAALTPNVRAHLAALQEHATHLVVRDDELCADVGWLVTEPAWLDSGVQAVAEAGAALTGTEDVSAGPFRS